MALAIALSFDDDVLLSLGVEGNNGIGPTSRQSLNLSAAMSQSMRPLVPEEIYTTSFTEQLQLALDPHNPNLQIDLGQYSCSWNNGKNQWIYTRQHGFRKLTRDELMQLMRRLRANPNVVHLNLMRQGIDGATMRVMATTIAALRELQVLFLGSKFFVY